MLVPAPRDVQYVVDPVLKEMKDRLRGFSCLCSLDAFKELLALYGKLVNELRQANLFLNFSKNHPGLQHKAGVPMGGTFIVAYNDKGVKSSKADKTYEKVTEAVPDGTVVADFYLPYRCCSGEPAVVFQVTDAEPEPEVVTLALQPNPKTT